MDLDRAGARDCLAACIHPHRHIVLHGPRALEFRVFNIGCRGAYGNPPLALPPPCSVVPARGFAYEGRQQQ
jgi:hypothetical protein